MDSDYEKLSGSNLVVPLLCLSDGSEFGERAIEVVHHGIGDHLRSVLESAAICDFDTASSRLFSEGFRTSIQPLELWDGRKPWCAWFIDLAASPRALADLTQLPAFASKFSHAFFLSVGAADAISNVHTQITGVAGLDARVWVLSQEGKLVRSTGSLGRGSGAYLAASWLRHIEDGGGEIDSAFGIKELSDYNGSGAEGLWTLGIGVAEPDIDYHVARWKGKLAESLRGLWLERADAHKPVIYPSPEEMVNLVLPDSGYSCSTYREERRMPDVEFPDARFQISGFPEFAGGVHGRRTRKLQMAELLSSMRDHYQFLKAVALPNARRAISRKMMGLRKKVTEVFAASLRPQTTPRAFINNMVRNVEGGAKFARELLSVEGKEPVTIRNFSAFWNSLRRALSAVPSIPGLCLRLSLIAIALGWLMLGPFVWQRFPTPLGHPVIERVFWTAAGLTVTLSLAVFVWFWFTRKRANAKLTHAGREIHLDHDSDVAALVAKAIRDSGGALSESAEKQLDRWERAKEHIAGTPAAAPTNAVNRNSLFDDRCTDQIIFEVKEDLLGATHRSVIAAIGENIDDLARWDSAIDSSTVATLEGRLKTVPFERYIDAAHLTEPQKADLLAAALKDAGSPCLDFDYYGEVRAICSAPHNWKSLVGTRVYTRFIPLDHHALVAVAPIAVPDEISNPPQRDKGGAN